jgi:acetyltransferase-like isoleucine patch superfamily enzyme
MILLKLIKYHINSIVRNLYWLYNLGRIKGISNSKLSFPITCEGKGVIELGVNCEINKKSKLLVAGNTTLQIGQDSAIKESVDICIGKGGSIRTKNNLLIEQYTRIFTNNHWHFGSHVKIATYCAIFSRESGKDGVLTLGNGSHIGDYTIIDVTDNVTIGDEVAIGPNCTLYTHDHNYVDSEKAAWKGGLVRGAIHIENGAWVGSNVTILPDIKIGKRAVIAAGSVVTKNVPTNEIWGGIPAKKIKGI